MHLRSAKRQSGLSLLELIVTTALMASLAVGMTQFIVVFYRYRLVDGVTSVLLSQTYRIQTEFEFFCNHATAMAMYARQSDRTDATNIQDHGNYFEATFKIESNGDAANPTMATRGIEYVPAQRAFLIYSYNGPGGSQVGSPTVIGLSRIAAQVSGQAVFGFRNHVPFLQFVSILPRGGALGQVLTSAGESFYVTSYAKPFYNQ